jgi:hypothetical protein
MAEEKRSERNKLTESDIKNYTLRAKEEAKSREIFLDPKLYVEYKFNLKQTYYELDAMQNQLLNMYLKQDPRFKRAFYTNFTSLFYDYLITKVRLREPIRLAIIGNQRGGKTSVAIGVQGLVNALYGRRTTINYICSDSFEFLERLQEMEMKELLNSCFEIDEEKQTVYGVGSTARKMKLVDVQNIIAMQNISTIMLNPTRWADATAEYGLRIFGRCMRTRTCRAMLYNLQEGSHGSSLPMGMVYLPIYNQVLPYWQELEKEYLIKKKTWIVKEQRSEGDILAEIKMKQARRFFADENYKILRKKKERIMYISTLLGSEYTEKEVEGIETLTQILKQGVNFEEQKSEKDEEEEDGEANEETS